MTKVAEPSIGTASAPAPPRLSKRSRQTLLEETGLPRAGRGIRHHQGDPDGWEWVCYLSRVATRVRLPRPVPIWAVDDLRRAGHAHLAAVRLQRLLDADPLPAEARRLRSEIRRSVSQARTAERVLAKLVAEVKAAERQQVPSIQTLLAQVGR